MSSADNFAFLLPLLQLTFGVAFLIVARWGSRPAFLWGIAYICLAGAYSAPDLLAAIRAEVYTIVSDALFLVGFSFLGQALLERFGQRRRLAAQLVLGLATLAAIAWALFVGESLRAELVLIDSACAVMLVAPLLLIHRQVRGSVDRTLVGLSWLIVADMLVRVGLYVTLSGDGSGVAGYAASSYAYFQQVSAASLAPIFGLTALATVTLDIVGRYRDAAERDPLTGLLNRRGFERAASAAGKAAAGAILTCDIDHFKRVNDGFGHATGDRVIVRLADLLCASVPEGGFVARFGGEEFVAFLPGHDEARADMFAEALRVAFARQDWSDIGIETRITASFGLSSPAPGDHSFHDAIARADHGLYAAKIAGRDRVMRQAVRPFAMPPLELVSAA